MFSSPFRNTEKNARKNTKLNNETNTRERSFLFSTHYLFQPTIGSIVHNPANDQMNKISRSALFVVSGFPDNPLTMTLYRSKAMSVIDQIEAQPQIEPRKA